MQDKPPTGENWTEISRSEMFSRVIVATDCARTEAIENGEAYFPRYVEDVLWPFLEAEREKAQLEEALER